MCFASDHMRTCLIRLNRTDLTFVQTRAASDHMLQPIASDHMHRFASYHRFRCIGSRSDAHKHASDVCDPFVIITPRFYNIIASSPDRTHTHTRCMRSVCNHHYRGFMVPNCMANKKWRDFAPTTERKSWHT